MRKYFMVRVFETGAGQQWQWIPSMLRAIDRGD
jgi:hypothetical protein